MKRLLALVTVLAFWACLSSGVALKKSQSFFRPDFDIQAQFKDYNEEYFNNKLPKDTRVTFENIPDDAIEGPILGLAYCNPEGIGCYIHISKKYFDTPAIFLEIELHEMVHIELMHQPKPYLEHGRPFQSEMKRIAMEDGFQDLW